MATVEFHHGTRVNQSGNEPVLVSLRNTSTGALVMPIETEDLPSGKSFDKPFLINTPSDAADLPDEVKEEIDSFHDQTVNRIVVVLVEKGEDAAATTAAMVGDATTKTGVHALTKATALGLPRPKLWAMAGTANTAADDGIASVSVDTAGTGYSEDTTTVTVSGDTGQGAVLKPVIGTSGAIDAIAIVKPGYGYTGTLTVTITDSGDGADATATATIGSVLNPVLAEAIAIADSRDMRAMIYADGPDSTDAEAVTARQLIGSKRVFFCDPRVLKSIDGVSYPKASSTVFAGLQARQDKTNGPVYPGSNMVINGIQGTNRPVTYGNDADNLNRNRVNTIINRAAVDGAGGFRAWGVWTCADDDINQFVNVVRTLDLIAESIEEAFLEFVDRPQTPGQLDTMVMTGRNALKGFEAEGFLLPGSDFWLLDSNNANDGAQGIVKFGFKAEPPAPAVDIRITAYRNIAGYELLYDRVRGQVEIGGTL